MNRRISSIKKMLLPLIIFFLFIETGSGINELAVPSMVDLNNALIPWQLDAAWSINQTGGRMELIGSGNGQALYKRPCKEGALKLSFKLREINGILNANINGIGQNRYTISILNNDNGTLSTYLTTYNAGAGRLNRNAPAIIRGATILFDPTLDNMIRITYNNGQIQVSYFPTIYSQEETVIDYFDEDPLSAGNVSFDLPGNPDLYCSARIYDVVVNCNFGNGGRPKLGICTFKRPVESMLISSPWGIVPANQVMVVVGNVSSFAQAVEVALSLAADLNGQVVGAFEFINLFQIETTSEDLNGLMNDLAFSKNHPSIMLAFPNEVIALEDSVPLSDDVYSKGGSKGYELVKAKDAWTLAGINRDKLCDVQVGVTDNGLFKGYGEFDGVVSVNLSSPHSELNSPGRDYPRVGSHGTGVMNILAADPDNGGIVGIASQAIREHLRVTMINIFPDDRGYVTDGLLGLKEEIEGGCTILSCSWGDSNAHEDDVGAFNEFFNRMYDNYPCILFICSAGNEGSSINGSKRIPNGKAISNVVTVGNVLNDGTRVSGVPGGSNMNSNNYEVTLAAPGQNAIWGLDNNSYITSSLGGTSMATPHVTAAAAIIRSIQPNLDAETIKTILQSSTDMKSDEVGGVLDIYKAMIKALGETCIQCENCSEMVATDIGDVPIINPVKPETVNKLGIVEGRLYSVTDSKGIANAEMIVSRRPEGDVVMMGIMTDDDGKFRFEIAAGSYQLGGRAAGYGVVPWAIDVYPGQTTKRDIRARRGI